MRKLELKPAFVIECLCFHIKNSNSIILICEHIMGIYEFEPEKNQVKKVTEFPKYVKDYYTSCYFTAVCVMENFILFCGGKTSESFEPVSDILLFSLSNKNDDWIHFQNKKLPKPIYNATCLYIPSLQIIILACDYKNNDECFDLEISDFWNSTKWVHNKKFFKNCDQKKIKNNT